MKKGTKVKWTEEISEALLGLSNNADVLETINREGIITEVFTTSENLSFAKVDDSGIIRVVELSRLKEFT